MQLIYKEFDDFIVFEKGFGIRVHRVSDGQFGLVEYLSEKLNQQLLVVHRLDKETSGLILFAKNKLAAQNLSELFEKHQIEKTYSFLTDKKIDKAEVTIKTHIEKIHNQFVNKPAAEANSETHFKFVKQIADKYLWQAFPKTGKPHQIRLHALQAGMPILGDSEHHGSRHYRLALHAEKLSFKLGEKDYSFESSLAESFTIKPDISYENLLEECYSKRIRMYQKSERESFRLIHDEAAQIRADLFADYLWIYDYSEKGLFPEEKKSVQSFAAAKKFKPVIRRMLDRGQGVGGLETDTLEAQDYSNWTAEEEAVTYQLKTDSGFSPGLFLDQRENRKWVRINSTNKTVLNLFAYTAGFSVNAALGGAKQVTTVDVSQKFLNWSKENFALNQIDSSAHEFFAQDCLLFLKGSVKRERKWDLIICDPPTFGRSKEGVWKIENDLPELAFTLFKCLEKNGKILFTCNIEKNTRDEIIELFFKKLPKHKFKIERLPMLSLDYELTDDLKNLMKGFIVAT